MFPDVFKNSGDQEGKKSFGGGKLNINSDINISATHGAITRDYSRTF